MGRFRAPLAAARLVTLSVFETVTGYSEKAVRRKIEEGVWLQGHEFIKAPDGRILVDMEGYQRWAFGQRRV
ncbi:MAG TPA: excisionase [Casimicrobiaceae bacterium]|nr:excisionase [Casimicrobiaceae bacterium]